MKHRQATKQCTEAPLRRSLYKSLPKNGQVRPLLYNSFTLLSLTQNMPPIDEHHPSSGSTWITENPSPLVMKQRSTVRTNNFVNCSMTFALIAIVFRLRAPVKSSDSSKLFSSSRSKLFDEYSSIKLCINRGRRKKHKFPSEKRSQFTGDVYMIDSMDRMLCYSVVGSRCAVGANSITLIEPLFSQLVALREVEVGTPY